MEGYKLSILQAAANQEKPVATPLPVPIVSPADKEDNLTWKQEALRRQVKELQAERSKLLHDLAIAKSEVSKCRLQGKYFNHFAVLVSFSK